MSIDWVKEKREKKKKTRREIAFYVTLEGNNEILIIYGWKGEADSTTLLKNLNHKTNHFFLGLWI